MIEISIVLLILFCVCFFAAGYGFGNFVEHKTIQAHEEEVDALTHVIDELYLALEQVFGAFTGDNVTHEQAEEAHDYAEFLLTNLTHPDKLAERSQ